MMGSRIGRTVMPLAALAIVAALLSATALAGSSGLAGGNLAEPTPPSGKAADLGFIDPATAPGGRIVAALGGFGGADYFGAARSSGRGRLDSSFGTGGYTKAVHLAGDGRGPRLRTHSNSIVSLAGGKLLVGGGALYSVPAGQSKTGPVGYVPVAVGFNFGVAHAAGERLVHPEARTTRAVDIEGDAALLRGVINPRGRQTVWRFQWGATRTYGHLADKYPPEEGFSDSLLHGVEEPIVCLSPHTTYHFRIVGYSHGVKVYGRDRSFHTSALRNSRAAAYKHCPGHRPVG
jgi:hypothetical protein